jgi:hypothetical protein
VGLSMAQSKAVTKQMTRRYERATKKEKGRLLDERAPSPGGAAGRPSEPLTKRSIRPSGPGVPGAGGYRPEVLEPLRRIWATLDGPTGSAWLRAWPRRWPPWNATKSSRCLRRSGPSFCAFPRPPSTGLLAPDNPAACGRRAAPGPSRGHRPAGPGHRPADQRMAGAGLHPGRCH